MLFGFHGNRTSLAFLNHCDIALNLVIIVSVIDSTTKTTQSFLPHLFIIVDIQIFVLADNSHRCVGSSQCHFAGETLSQGEQGMLDQRIAV